MSWPNSHYNTTHLKGKKLKQKNSKARTQENWVEKVMRSDPDKGFTAHEVWEVAIRSKMEELSKMNLVDALTVGRELDNSLRRATTNLKTKGVLVKTKEKRRDNYVYKINTNT